MPQRQHESSCQINLVLDGLQAPDSPDQQMLRGVKRASCNHLPLLGWLEYLGINAIADLFDLGRSNTDPQLQVSGKFARQRDKAMHKQAIAAPQPLIAAAAGKVCALAAMLAVDSHWHTRSPGRQLRLEGSQIAAVHDRRLPLLEQAVETRVKPEALPWRLVQGNELDICAPDTQAEIAHLGQGHDQMPELADRQMVD